jgi:hypothetical protein
VIIKIRDKNKKREREQQAAESGEEASPGSNANNHDVSPRSETVCNVQIFHFFRKSSDRRLITDLLKLTLWF